MLSWCFSSGFLQGLDIFSVVGRIPLLSVVRRLCLMSPTIVLKLAIIYEFVGNDNPLATSQRFLCVGRVTFLQLLQVYFFSDGF